jgi:hypothetical protein
MKEWEEKLDVISNLLKYQLDFLLGERGVHGVFPGGCP